MNCAFLRVADVPCAATNSGQARLSSIISKPLNMAEITNQTIGARYALDVTRSRPVRIIKTAIRSKDRR